MKKHLLALLSVGLILALPSCKNEEKDEMATQVETTEQKQEDLATQIDNQENIEVSSTELQSEQQVEKF